MYATFRVGLLIGLAIRMAARIRRGVLELSVKREKSIFAAMSTLKYSVFAAFLPRLMLSTPSSLMGFLSFSVDLALRRPPGFSRTTDVVSGKAGWEVDLDVIRESLRGPEVKLVQETECITHTSWLATPLSYQLSHLPCALLALCGLLSGWALMELKGLWRRPNWRPTRFLQRVSEIVQRFCFLVQGIGGVLGVLALSQSPLVLLWSFLHDFITAWRSTGVLRHCYGMFACIWTRRGSLSGEALAIIALARVAHDDNADEGVRAWARRVLPALRARGTEDGEQPPFLPQEEVGEGQPAVEGMGGAEVEGEDDTGPQGAGAVGAPERQRPFRRRRRRRILSLTRALVAPFAAVGREPHPLHAVLSSSASSPNTKDLFDFIFFVGPGGQSDGRTAPSFVAVQLAQRHVHMGVFAASRWQSDFEIVSGLIELGHFEGTEPQAVKLAAVQGNIGLCSSCPPGAMDKHIVPHLDVVGWAASSVGISDLTRLGCFESGTGGLNSFFIFLQKVRGLGGRLNKRRKRKSREREGFSSVFELKGRATCPDMDRYVVCTLKRRDEFRPSVMLGLNEAMEGLLDCLIHAFCWPWYVVVCRRRERQVRA
eukprot:Cvel_5268.t2-p1 / transcript=Cvel_5268.t2 / gene=Cvel_5268 / organism=Chromera_velia_CCMP2878 / gene_product=hypothetical protein / transcript_product=hypothetical protein / location=Cvel_scaffold243:64392-68026(+) / protein_length=596 / sequence_SO=supercontig / SO=protein_coding / is_pseudo=false